MPATNHEWELFSPFWLQSRNALVTVSNPLRAHLANPYLIYADKTLAEPRENGWKDQIILLLCQAFPSAPA